MPKIFTLVLLLAFVSFSAWEISAQTTEFTFQGSLRDNVTPANGNYDFEFALFDALSGGTQLGSTLSRNGVAVANGIFSVKLDFGNQFPGANRFMEIRVRLAGQPGITTLGPRQLMNSAPYSVKSLTADSVNVGGIPAGSGNYIQNSTNIQASSNFNISGSGTMNILSVNQIERGGLRLLGTSPGSLYVGIGAGTNDPGSVNNTMVGILAGSQTTTGIENAFFGTTAGQFNTSGSQNSFFGLGAGRQNTTATGNSFFGSSAGLNNTTGGGNSFFGSGAGSSNTTGPDNSFFGRGAGASNTTGFHNAFFGENTGSTNTSGARNAFFGKDAGVTNTGGDSNAFFGAGAGDSNTTGGVNSFIGASAGDNNTTGFSNAFFGSGAGFSNTTGDHNTVIGNGANVGSNNLSFATAIGAGSIVSQSNTVVLGRAADIVRVPGSFASVGGLLTNANLTVLGNGIIAGTLDVATLSLGGATDVCRNASNELSTCSSSLRYKSNIQPFTSGLNVVRNLRPITFRWNNGKVLDIGFGAEDVAKVEPLLVTHNDEGEVEGVKYKQITTVLVNAVKEQQAQIEVLQKTNAQQQQENAELRKQVEALRAAVCSIKADTDVCKEKEEEK